MIEIERFSLPWQMTNCEKFTLELLLQKLTPQVSIEIGTYKGGSLQVLSHFSKEVISIDIDPTVTTALKSLFPNVSFLIGDSSTLLKEILAKLSNEERKVQFILIDGDHSELGVKKDIDSILKWKPTSNVLLLMHDSFNPACRRGILSADWQSSPYVHSLEVDFTPGIFHEFPHDTAAAKTMWGGFACAQLKSYPRTGALTIGISQQALFQAVYSISSHRNKTLLYRVINFIKRTLL